MPTATIESEPPRISCAWKLSPYGPEGQDRADAEREERSRRAMPIHSRGSTSRRPILCEVGDEDADDEAGFEAFTQADQEVREHR